MVEQKTSDVQAAYDIVADEYVRRIFDELKDKPLDCRLLDRFAENVRGRGLICDLGCGPGHVARFLHERGVMICGVDLSPEMVVRARRLNPEIEFTRGDMLALDVADETWAGIVAFYAIVNLPRGDLMQAAREMKRVLRPGAPLLLSFHLGTDIVHLGDWWGHEVAIDFHFFQADEVARVLADAGFCIDETIERDPYPNVEHPSRRAYIFARKREADDRPRS
jgi:SAM-dependent methyltransferase